MARIILTSFAVAVLVSASITAQAGLIHNLEITDDLGGRPNSSGIDGLSGSGQITFTSLSGTDSSGVSAFSFAGIADDSDKSGLIHRFSLGINDLDQIAWNIDNNWNLSIGFATNRIALPTTTDFCLIFMINNPTFTTCRVTGSPNAGFGPGATGAPFLFSINGTGSGSAGSPSSSPVPTPSAMLMMGTGLAGLIGWRRWSLKTTQDSDDIVVNESFSY
ncbi:MAG: PEP-CTERM sorting domain-containing protein [Nitrospirales bacterium]